jgi:hypothetical protein
MNYEGPKGAGPLTPEFNHSAFIIFKQLNNNNYLNIKAIWEINSSASMFQKPRRQTFFGRAR